MLVAGRRFGKTVLAIAWLLARVMEREPGSRGYYVLPYRVQAKDVAWSELLAATRGLRIAKNESELSVTLPGNRRIVLKGADNPETLEGVGLVAAVLDEFARMKLAAWEKSLRPALSDHKGRVLFIGKPRGHNHLKLFFERGLGASKRPAWRSWLYRTADGGFVSPEDIAEAKRDLPPKVFRQEYEATFETLAGRIFDEFSTQLAPVGHVVPAALVPQHFNRVVISIDWGFTHPGVAVVTGEAGDGALYIAAEEFHREFGVDRWDACLRSLHARYPGAEWFADPSRPDFIRTFSERIGITIQRADNNVFDGITDVAIALHPREGLGPRLLVSDACPEVIAGLDRYVWATSAAGDPVERPEKVNDDAADAVRYGVTAFRSLWAVTRFDDGLMDDR